MTETVMQTTGETPVPPTNDHWTPVGQIVGVSCTFPLPTLLEYGGGATWATALAAQSVRTAATTNALSLDFISTLSTGAFEASK